MKIRKGVLVEVSQKDIENGVFVVPNNVNVIGVHCFSGIDVEKVIIPSGVNQIERYAFKKCKNLKEVKFSYGLWYIGLEAFGDCHNLEKINLPASLKTIDGFAFRGCTGLKKVSIPKNVTRLSVGAFAQCDSLETVHVNANLTSLSEGVFQQCTSLKYVSLPDKISRIEYSCFKECKKLEYLKFPENLYFIGSSAFYGSGLKRVDFPEKVRQINVSAFGECSGLEKVEIPELVTTIDINCFNHCYNLKTVKFHKNILGIYESAFDNCSKLENVELPENLNVIGKSAFHGCRSLKKINIPSTVEEISDSAFNGCYMLSDVQLNEGLKVIGHSAFCDTNLTYLKFPNSLEEIHSRAFVNTSIDEVILGKNFRNLEHAVFSKAITLSIYDNVSTDLDGLKLYGDLTIINPVTGHKTALNGFMIEKILNTDGLVIVYPGSIEFYDSDNNWISVDRSVFLEHGFHDMLYYKKYYAWMTKHKFLPHISVMKNMNYNDINNFFINNNDYRWKELLLLADISSHNDIEGFFKLAYSLGVFSKSAKVSEHATEFIKQYIFKYEKNSYSRFRDMDVVNKGYDSEFAKLVFKYYPVDKENFLFSTNEKQVATDYFAKVYNDFDLIRKIYYNKEVNTNSLNKMLTPQLCMNYDYTLYTKYKGVIPGNEMLATNVAMYGYNQNVFDKVQRYFQIGKKIPVENLTVRASKDSKSSGLVYELLSKDDPLGPILGNITNNCQTAVGLARSCVFHGMSEANSGFIAFKKDDYLIGESWVWYDEYQKRVCLDNIEIAKSVLENKIKAIYWKNEMINCIKRLSAGIVEEMGKAGLDLETITIGEGHNDMGRLLGVYFKKITDQPHLTHYSGYTDATNQFVIYDRKQDKKGERK